MQNSAAVVFLLVLVIVVTGWIFSRLSLARRLATALAVLTGPSADEDSRRHGSTTNEITKEPKAKPDKNLS
jgi:hypothetical protein